MAEDIRRLRIQESELQDHCDTHANVDKLIVEQLARMRAYQNTLTRHIEE